MCSKFIKLIVLLSLLVCCGFAGRVLYSRFSRLCRTRERSTSHRPSRKLELGRFLSSIDWSVLNSSVDCSNKLRLFSDLVKTGLDIIMPFKSFRLHVNDAPWVTAEFKNLIKQRQSAFARGDQEQFRQLRNAVNRERKLCRSRYYSSKVADLKNVKPGKWWGEVKKIAGMTSLQDAKKFDPIFT